ncbi:MAG: hypothetical protein K6G22_01340 [Lachnospiraceae bacterium]|nr:hypothetical protein [Lachnospiraceae bacterium]
MLSAKKLSKRLASVILAGAMGVSLCACGGTGTVAEVTEPAVTETEVSDTQTSDDQDVSDTADDAQKKDEDETADEEEKVTRGGMSLDDMSDPGDEWKELMWDAVEETMEYYFDNNQDEEIEEFAVYLEKSEFALLYVDDDDIPEVYVMPASGMMDGSTLLYLDGDKVESFDIGWSDSFSYVEKKSLIDLYHGMHVPCQDVIMTFPEQEVLGNGAFAEPGWFDGKDHSVDGADTEYMWDDEFVSEEDYQKKMDAVFSGDIHVSFEEDRLSYEELMDYLTTPA